MAAAYSSGAMELLLQNEFAAFHVSGGTTEMLHVAPNRVGFSVTLVGETADLNAGQAIDRIGVSMGLAFPCGKALEELAEQNVKRVPKPRVCVRDGKCNLSGLQNLAEKLLKETNDRALVAAYVQSFLAQTLCEMTEYLDTRYPAIPVVYAGGVMSNRYLQKILSKRNHTYFAEPMFSADNAAGISLLCRQRYLTNQ
jgi:N6-L-threonylcarbamoyladenine synthase